MTFLSKFPPFPSRKWLQGPSSYLPTLPPISHQPSLLWLQILYSFNLRLFSSSYNGLYYSERQPWRTCRDISPISPLSSCLILLSGLLCSSILLLVSHILRRFALFTLLNAVSGAFNSSSLNLILFYLFYVFFPHGTHHLLKFIWPNFYSYCSDLPQPIFHCKISSNSRTRTHYLFS